MLKVRNMIRIVHYMNTIEKKHMLGVFTICMLSTGWLTDRNHASMQMGSTSCMLQTKEVSYIVQLLLLIQYNRQLCLSPPNYTSCSDIKSNNGEFVKLRSKFIKHNIKELLARVNSWL